ncbi:MAG: O-antigen ligase family protein [Actinomycetota bacterium]|nr:O-antigen ligase family protein [Actinomycetota bacterium]
MSAFALSAGRRTLARDTAFVGGAIALAAAVGVATAENPVLGIAAAIGLIALPMAILRPRLIPPVLMISVFTASLELGTVTVGRLIAPLGLLAVVVYLLQQPLALKNAGLLVALCVGYLILAFASLTWSIDYPTTLDTLLTLSVSVGYAATFAFLVQDERDLKRLLWVTTFSSMALAMLWISAYVTGVDRRFNEAGDPNFFAALQVVSLPLVLVLASTTKNPLHRLFLGGAIGLIAASVISTLSVGGLVTVATAAVVIAILPASALFQSRAQKGVFMLVALVGLGAFMLVAQEDLNARLDVKLRDESVAGGRADLWHAAMSGYKEHPWTGMGYGGFYGSSFQLLRTTPGVDLESHLRFVGVGEYVHNAFLGSLAELGPVGAVLFIAILLTAFRTLWRSAERAGAAGDLFKRSVAYALIVGLIAFTVSSFLLSTETSRTLWTILGITVALATMTSNRSAVSA